MSKKTFYVTTPIYYPSGNLHIGHVYTTTLAWALRNYKRAQGFDAIMLTGSDEHGQKIEQKAKEQKMRPQEYTDKMSKKFKDIWKDINIDFDIFSRTTNKDHKESVRKQFSSFLEKDLIYKGNYKGLYSVQDEEFLTLRQAKKVDNEYFHPTSNHKLKEVEEESYFFKMSNYEKWIKEYYKENPNFIFPEKIVKELLNNFINKGLEDLSISRKTFSWGIDIKEDPKHIIYVWMDALNNYITFLGYNQEDNSNFKKYWENGDEIVHIVGKEITRFHCIYWPIFLEAAGLRQPTKIVSHGWIITPEGKMSKSKGNVIDPVKLINKYGNEQLKYYLASQINVGQDGTFNEEKFVDTINSDLANNFGNLLSRTIAMTIQNFDGPVTFSKTFKDEDKKMLDDIKTHFDEYQKYFDEYKIAHAIREAMILSKKLNGYIDVTMPWKLKENKEELEKVLNILLNGIYAVASMLEVVIPNSITKVKKQLGIKELSFKDILDFNKFDSIKVQKSEVIFEKLER